MNVCMHAYNAIERLYNPLQDIFFCASFFIMMLSVTKNDYTSYDPHKAVDNWQMVDLWMALPMNMCSRARVCMRACV